MLPSASEAIDWFRENTAPDLIFSDIQLQDADCFRIFETVEIKCPIIFCTAYDEYAIKAFETNGIDYLLKPVDKARLEKSLQKLDNWRVSPAYVDIGRLVEIITPALGRTVLVHHKEKIIPVNHADIAFFYYGDGAVTVRLLNGTTWQLTQGIDELQQTTDARLFYRANRQFIINRHAIRDIERFFARKLVVKLTLETPEAVVVSKAKASDFLGWLEGAGR
jgi:DNA-binding LytR/AlgR family response regulator